jgi:hypothetical protein
VDVQLVRRSLSTQSHRVTIPGLFASQLGGKEAADRAIARCFYANAIPFNVADTKHFKEAIKAIAACGPTYVPPGRKAIGTTLIDQEVTAMKQQLEAAKKNLQLKALLWSAMAGPMSRTGQL